MNTKPLLDTTRFFDCQDDSNKLYGLDDLCKKYINDSMTVLEMGSHYGVSTELLCYYAKHVVSIDCKYNIEIEELEEKVDNLLFKHGSFSEIINSNKGDKSFRFDLIYIDGLHDYENVKEDMLISLPLLNDGGFISGHDFSPEYPGVEKAVREIFPNSEIEIFTDTSWLIKTNGQ